VSGVQVGLASNIDSTLAQRLVLAYRRLMRLTCSMRSRAEGAGRKRVAQASPVWLETTGMENIYIFHAGERASVRRTRRSRMTQRNIHHHSGTRIGRADGAIQHYAGGSLRSELSISFDP